MQYLFARFTDAFQETFTREIPTPEQQLRHMREWSSVQQLQNITKEEMDLCIEKAKCASDFPPKYARFITYLNDARREAREKKEEQIRLRSLPKTLEQQEKDRARLQAAYEKNIETVRRALRAH